MKNILLLVALGFALSAPVRAQTLPEWGEPTPTDFYVPSGDDLHGPTLPDAPDPVPIDGGLGLLGAAGAAYALKRLRRRKAEGNADV